MRVIVIDDGEDDRLDRINKAMEEQDKKKKEQDKEEEKHPWPKKRS